MKKFLFVIVAMFVSIVYLNAQTNLYSTDFESFTVGGKIAQQAGAPWTTWSSAPGGAEDPVVSSTVAHSGSNSIYVVNANDGVLHLSDKTTGRYKVEWYMYVESGKLGYFNLLSDFAGSTSKWAFQAYVYHDSIFIDANGTRAAVDVFASNTWTKLHLIIDLDDDFATFYKNDVEIISYKWSKGAQGSDNSLKLDGVNFYGWDGTGSPVAGGQSGYYIDDVDYDSVPNPGGSSIALTATLSSGDVNLSWTAASPSPSLYKLTRNGVALNTTTGLSYTDAHPWPDTYYYNVRAKYSNQGYSHASNTDSAIIAGGVSRDLVLYEKGTSIFCTYCPYAAQGIKALVETNQKDAVAIAYHPTSLWGSFADAYGNTSSETRLVYYGISGFPTVIADGKLKIEGVVQPYANQYSQVYLPWYNERIAAKSFHSIDLDVVSTGLETYSATIIVQESFDAFTSVKLHAALTESNIPVSWYGQTEVDYVNRGMYPDANGTTLNFATQNPQTVTLNFSTTGYIKDNCQFVVFVQDPVTKLVTQTVMQEMSAVIGIDEINGANINIYPNPASEYIIANTQGTGELEIFDISGKLVLQKILSKTTETFDISGFNKGIYLVKYTTEKNTFNRKLIIE